MKLRHFITTASLAGLAYWAAKHKDALLATTKNRIETIQDLKKQQKNIEKQIHKITSFQEPLKEMATDLNYKLRVYQTSIAPHVDAIQSSLENMKKTDTV